MGHEIVIDLKNIILDHFSKHFLMENILFVQIFLKRKFLNLKINHLKTFEP